MTMRAPRSLNPSNLAETGLGVLEYELAAERASSLGRQGLSVEQALCSLMTAEEKGVPVAEREQLVDTAAQAVWALFVQRDICGLRNTRDVIQRYGIPNHVLARLGAAPRR
ncbi:DUF6665 family protein [Rhizobium sp. Rhizsp82]|uniref:DUF6665 family protein n=1 Tax=Rhizobium sp. Rhizsp82 TaxID=3243057 RepID=UPI0039B46DC4